MDLHSIKKLGIPKLFMVNNKSHITNLANLRKESSCYVISISAGGKSAQRLRDMGLTDGTRIIVTQHAPFKGPLEILVRGTRLAVSRNLAKHIVVGLKE